MIRMAFSTANTATARMVRPSPLWRRGVNPLDHDAAQRMPEVDRTLWSEHRVSALGGAARWRILRSPVDDQPVAGCVSCKKYPKVSRCRVSSSASTVVVLLLMSRVAGPRPFRTLQICRSCRVTDHARPSIWVTDSRSTGPSMVAAAVTSIASGMRTIILLLSTA